MCEVSAKGPRNDSAPGPAAFCLGDEDDDSESNYSRGSLTARYDAIGTMASAALAGGEEARRTQDEVLEALKGATVHALDAGEERQLERRPSFEWQYDALGAGGAIAAVAAARGTTPGVTPLSARSEAGSTPPSASGTWGPRCLRWPGAVAASSPPAVHGGLHQRPPGHGPGFFARDAASALRERAEWEARLGAGAVLCSDDLSDASSEWEDGPQGAVAEEGDQEGDGTGASSPTKASPKESLGSVECEPVQFGAARARFAAACGREASCGARRAACAEPLPVRLRRVRAEVGALVAWCAGASEDATMAAMDGATASASSSAAGEAARLGQEAHEMARLLHVATSSTSGGRGCVRAWLPPSGLADASAVQCFLELGRLPSSGQSQQATSSAARGRSAGCELTLCGGAGARGWRAAAEAEQLEALEGRLARLRALLGARRGAGSPAQGAASCLAGAASRLHRRLAALEKVSDEGACDRLGASVRLLAADIADAAAEAGRACALEAEEQEASHGAPGDAAVAETPEWQIGRLHSQVAGLDAVALRVVDVEKRLQSQELTFSRWIRFADELRDAEEGARHAREVLADVSRAVQQMQESALASRKQLLRNLAVLMRKIPTMGVMDLAGR